MDDNRKLTLHPQRAEEITDNRRCRLTTIAPTFSPKLSRHVVGVVHIAVALALTATLCVLFVDRPVTSYFSRHTNLLRLFQFFATPSLLTGPAAELFLAYAAVRWLRGAPRVNRIWLTMSLARMAGGVIKNALQYLFGRPWPDTWLQSGVYQFHPFTDNALYGSLPSGHTTFIAAPMCVLWVLVPNSVWCGPG